jgi:hypothetical protein
MIKEIVNSGHGVIVFNGDFVQGVVIYAHA